MKGLILKDIYNLKQHEKMYVLMMAVWLAIAIIDKDSNFFAWVMTLFTLIVPISTIAYDEKAKWDRYALTMPLSRTDLVVSKYLLALLCALVGNCIAVIVGLVVSGNVKETLLSAMTFVSLGMVIVSVVLPFIFKLGVEKGRLVVVLVFLAPTLLGIFLPRTNLQPPSEAMIMQAIYFSPLIALVVTLCSIGISKSIYAHKEF